MLKVFYIDKLIPVCDDCRKELINMDLVERREENETVLRTNIKDQSDLVISSWQMDLIIHNSGEKIE